ncbi:MAG: ABC transporter ATP-binding protein [Gemmatimonadaceae bacterium]|nr:ABC transporter ATP-binding protein [Gemmatimonadaceae bacterium]
MSEATMTTGSAVLEAEDVVREYASGDGATLRILDGVTVTVERGEMVAIIGESGAGKSTLLQILGGLDRPTAGRVRIAGADVTRGSDEAIAAVRNRSVGFVFQFHHLLRDFSALENVMFPLRIGGQPAPVARDRARALLDAVGLGARVQHRPAQLSGGEQQRVAVARALAAEPALVLADEPSGNLDRGNALRLHDLLASLAQTHGVGVVVVTHNRGLAARADRVLLLELGRLVASSAMAEEVG